MALLAFAATFAAPSSARAQTCCTGATALTPARLAMHEDALIGLLSRNAVVYGSFDRDGAFLSSPSGSTEIDLEQDLLIAVRPFRNAQLAISVPMVETYRGATSLGEISGGLGDITYSLRYDLRGASEVSLIPGVALLGALTLPTGTPPEAASKPLATDATGKGAVQAALGLSLERESGHSVFQLTGSVAYHGPRTIGISKAQEGLEFVAFGAGGYVFTSGSAILLTLTYTIGLPGELDDLPVSGSGHSKLRTGVAFGHALSSDFRLQGGVYSDLPIPGSGRSQPLSSGFSLAVLSPWM